MKAEAVDLFLSITEIARRIGLDRKTVVKLWREGRIPIVEFSPRKKGMFESSFREWITRQGGDHA